MNKLSKDLSKKIVKLVQIIKLLKNVDLDIERLLTATLIC